MPSDRLLPDVFSEYRQRRLLGRSPATLEKYWIEIRRFARFLQRTPKLSDLTDVTVARLLEEQLNSGASPYTVNKCRACLLAIWRFACRQGYLERWPEIDKLNEPQRTPRAWSQQQIGTLLRVCQEQQGMIGDVPAGQWWSTLHLVGWDTGERIGALLQLRWDDYERPWMYIPAEVRKGKRADRVFRLHPDTCAALERIRSPRRRIIFPWPFAYNYLWPRYTKLLLQAGLPTDRQSKFHRIRKSLASHYEAAGGNATQLLGHSGRRTTKAYIDPTIVPQQHASDVLFRPGEGRAS